jgi:hypothetical protein
MAAASRIRRPQPLERGRELPLALPALAIESTPATDQGKNRVESAKQRAIFVFFANFVRFVLLF